MGQQSNPNPQDNEKLKKEIRELKAQVHDQQPRQETPPVGNGLHNAVDVFQSNHNPQQHGSQSRNHGSVYETVQGATVGVQGEAGTANPNIINSMQPGLSRPQNSEQHPQQNEAAPPRRGVGSTDQALILATQVVQASRLIPNEVKKPLQDFIREEHNPVWGTYTRNVNPKTTCLISWFAFSYSTREPLRDRMMLYGAWYGPSFTLFFPEKRKAEFTPLNSGGTSADYVNPKNREYNSTVYMKQTDAKDKTNGAHLFQALEIGQAGQTIDDSHLEKRKSKLRARKTFCDLCASL